MWFELVNILILIMIIIASLCAVLLRDLFVAAIAFAIMSLLLSLEFFVLQAPVVAIVQIGVGVCLSTAILIIAIRRTTRMEDE